ncbi:MAG: homocysteine S-methyltransferase family protein [Candidatus Xenobiia bacterium LiM19]
MSAFLPLLEKGPLILDGATGTELMARGLIAGECPERWNLIYPERVALVHKSYYDAGSDIVYTNTFGGNRIKLGPYGLDGQVEEINRKAVEIARSVCPPGALVAGDIGPTGKFLPPVGDGDPAAIKTAFEEQARSLAEGGADLLVVETMYDMREAEMAVQAALLTGLPVCASLTFSKKKRGYFTIMGDAPQKAFLRLRELGACAVGTNCSLDFSEMLLFLDTLDVPAISPLLMKPNAGQPRIEGETAVYDANPDDFAQAVQAMITKGVGLAGGCCGTSPVFIERLARLIKGRPQAH